APAMPSAPVTPAAPVVPAVQVEDNLAPAVSEDATDKQSKPVESKTESKPVESKTVESAKPSAKPSESNVAKENAKTAESAETSENNDVQDRPANETDEKISDTESEKPQVQASATAENKSSGNMLSTIMLGVLGALTISGAAAAGVTFMRHRRLPKA
ncbi:chromosome partitioning protein ParA, partial [Bifidobacteriaceae bacterium WP012]